MNEESSLKVVDVRRPGALIWALGAAAAAAVWAASRVGSPLAAASVLLCTSALLWLAARRLWRVSQLDFQTDSIVIAAAKRTWLFPGATFRLMKRPALRGVECVFVMRSSGFRCREIGTCWRATRSVCAEGTPLRGTADGALDAQQVPPLAPGAPCACRRRHRVPQRRGATSGEVPHDSRQAWQVRGDARVGGLGRNVVRERSRAGPRMSTCGALGFERYSARRGRTVPAGR